MDEMIEIKVCFERLDVWRIDILRAERRRVWGFGLEEEAKKVFNSKAGLTSQAF